MDNTSTAQPVPTRTLTRLRKATTSDSYRTLSQVAVDDLVSRGLFSESHWAVTAKGQAVLDAANAARVPQTHVCGWECPEQHPAPYNWPVSR